MRTPSQAINAQLHINGEPVGHVRDFSVDVRGDDRVCGGDRHAPFPHGPSGTVTFCVDWSAEHVPGMPPIPAADQVQRISLDYGVPRWQFPRSSLSRFVEWEEEDEKWARPLRYGKEIVINERWEFDGVRMNEAEQNVSPER